MGVKKIKHSENTILFYKCTMKLHFHYVFFHLTQQNRDFALSPKKYNEIIISLCIFSPPKNTMKSCSPCVRRGVKKIHNQIIFLLCIFLHLLLHNKNIFSLCIFHEFLKFNFKCKLYFLK